MTTTNLGIVKAIHVGVSAPSNTAMIWFDDNAGQKLHKYYDTTTSTWIALKDNIGKKYTEVITSNSGKSVFTTSFDISVNSSKVVIAGVMFEITALGSGEEVEKTGTREITTAFTVNKGEKIIIYEY